MKKILLYLAFLLLNAVTLHAQNSHWEVNIPNYQYDMTVYAELIIDGIAVEDYSNFDVAAFNDEECCGIAVSQSAMKDDKAYNWLSIRVKSNTPSGEKITFKVYDKMRDEVLPIKESIIFEDQTSVGLPSSPISLSIQKFTLGDVNDDGEIDITDVVSIVKFISDNYSQIFIEEAADINQDNDIDITDVVTLVKSISNQ